MVFRWRRRCSWMLASVAMLGAGAALHAADETVPASRYVCKDVSELLGGKGDETPPLPPRPRAGGPPVKSVAELLATRQGESAPSVAETSLPSPPANPPPPLPTDQPSPTHQNNAANPLGTSAGRATVSLRNVETEGREAVSEPVPLPPRHEPSPQSVRSDRRPPPAASTLLDVRVATRLPPSPSELPPGEWRSRESGGAVSSGPVTTSVAPAAATPKETPPVNGGDPPLFNAGVFRSDALFSGVPVVVGELAPTPIGSDEHTSGQALAALPQSLAPQPLLGPAGGEVLAQRDYLGGEPSPPPPTGPADAEPLTPERLQQISNAADELHRPLRSIRMSQHLEGRHPADLAAEVHPSLHPEQLWGAPWPSDPLRWYRYTVPFEHRPLYFEQPNLERCGHHWGVLTPYASAAHFFGNIVLLPVHAVIDLPCVPVPTLGDCPTGCSYGLCPTLNRRR